MVLLALEGGFGFHNGKMARIFFITGTDTGVGKTVLTALLARFLRGRGVNAAALKPVCSGGRGDARIFSAAMDGALPLDKINPWHFHAPVAPHAGRAPRSETRPPFGSAGARSCHAEAI